MQAQSTRGTAQRSSSLGHQDILVAHSGKQHAYQLARSLQKLGRLQQLITSSYCKPSQLPDKLFCKNASLAEWLNKRTLADLEPSKVTRRWRYEMPEFLWKAAFGNGHTADRLVFSRDARFDRWVSGAYARHASIFWGFQGSCLESLKCVNSVGGMSIIELATAHVVMAERILQAESEKHPEWASTISNFSFPQWYRDRLCEEPKEANRCVVASDFSRRSLLEVGVSESKISVLPLGADLQQFYACDRVATQPLKVLFAGGIGQRKGIKYLLDAVRQLNSTKVELALVGPLPADETPLHEYSDFFTYKGRMSQEGVADEMRRSHLLVLPSVFEGFGLVIAEAMATGMPVIASTHSAGPELIEHGVNGFIVEPWDVDAISTHIDALAADPRIAVDMGQNAAKAATEMSWDAHAIRLGALLDRWPCETEDHA